MSEFLTHASGTECQVSHCTAPPQVTCKDCNEELCIRHSIKHVCGRFFVGDKPEEEEPFRAPYH